jgi:hypothetical protein
MEDSETLKPTRRIPWRAIVLFLLLIGAFAFYARYNITQRATGQQTYDVFDARLENLDNSIRLHEKRLTELEQKLPIPPQGAVPAEGNATATDARIAALEKKLADIKPANPDKPQSSEQVFQAIHLLSAFHHLSEKVVAGKPFASELSAYEEADGDAANSPPIVALSPYADNGIPTFAQLLASFDNSLEALGAMEATPPAGATLWQRFVFNLTHLISVRRTDEHQAEHSVDAILSRAQAHLDREEIEAAMMEIKSLPEHERSNFASWLEDARITTEALGLVDAIEEQAMQKAFNAEPSKMLKGQP